MATHQPASRPAGTDERISVVMITRDRRERALAAVPRLLALPERPAVVVVDNGSSDDTAATIRRYHPQVTVLEPGMNLASAGRNLGVRAARSRYVAFADDDSSWEPGALARAADLLDAHPRCALVAARTLVGSEWADDPLNAALAAAPLDRPADLPGPAAVGFLACAAVVRRSAFLAAGGFHRRFGVGGEEELLAIDLVSSGWGLAYAEEVVARHLPDGQERPGRTVRDLRNALWTAWLRRPLPLALRRTLPVLTAALGGERVATDALRAALAGLPWVLRERAPVSAAVERMLRAVEAGE